MTDLVASECLCGELTPEIVLIASCLTRYVAVRQAFFSSLMVRVILVGPGGAQENHLGPSNQ